MKNHAMNCETTHRKKLNSLLDELWLIIDEENAVQLYEISQMIREIFNDIFNILSKQQTRINEMEKRIEELQATEDELLIGSVGTQLLIKLSRFGDDKEHPSIAACRSISMITTQPHVERLKTFLDRNGYVLEEVCLAVRVLKNNRNATAHPNNPSTSAMDILNAIDRLFPTLHPKRKLAQKALEVLEILSKQLQEPLFLQLDS